MDITLHMKRKLLILICFTTCIVSSYAQTETNRDSISINIDNKLSKSSSLDETKHHLNIDVNTKALDPEELRRRAEFVKSLQFKTPEFYVGPPTGNQTLGEKLPHTNDYKFSNYTSLEDDFSISTISQHNTYLSIGANRMVNINLNYQATDWLSLSGGVYGAKYNAYGQHYNDAGFNASLRLKLHERIYLRGYGNYSINSNDRNRYLGPAAMGMGAFPQTYYGGGVEFKISDNFGIEGGVVREFNPMKRKWDNIPYIMPVIYSNGRRR